MAWEWVAGRSGIGSCLLPVPVQLIASSVTLGTALDLLKGECQCVSE